MNAEQEEIAWPLNAVLSNLCLVTKEAKPNISRDFTITCWAEDPEGLNGNLEVLKYLKENSAIENYFDNNNYNQKEVEIGIGEAEPDRADVYSIEITCRLKPKSLKDFMINTSIVPKYFIKFIEHKGKMILILNNKYILSCPRYGNQAYDLFDVIYKNPRRKLTRKFIEKIIKEINQSDYEIKRRIDGLLADLGFKKELRKIFFPHVTQEALFFRNDVFNNELTRSPINNKSLENQIKKLKLFVETV